MKAQYITIIKIKAIYITTKCSLNFVIHVFALTV